MAEIIIPVSDQNVLDYVVQKFALNPGKTIGSAEVNVVAQPYVENSVTSHIVEVTLRYGLELGEINKLAGL